MKHQKEFRVEKVQTTNRKPFFKQSYCTAEKKQTVHSAPECIVAEPQSTQWYYSWSWT